MEVTMTRQAAMTMAKDLYSQGKNYRQISFALMRNGYISNRTGHRLKPTGIYQMLRANGVKIDPEGRTRTKRKPKAIEPKAPRIVQRGNKIIIELIVSTR